MLWVGLVMELTLLSAWRFDMTRSIAAGVVIEIFSGREAGIPVALQGGAPPWLVAQVSFTQDVAAAAIAYPLFLWALHHYHDRDNFFMRRLRRIESAAARHEAYVHRWGPVAVFGFMLVPFAINGPLAGGILGRLAGIPTHYLYLPVIGATAVAALSWTYAYDTLFRVVDDVDGRIAPLATVAILALVVGFMVLSEWTEQRRRAKA